MLFWSINCDYSEKHSWLVWEIGNVFNLFYFASFALQGKHVAGNDVYVANIVQKRKYRQVLWVTDTLTLEYYFSCDIVSRLLSSTSWASFHPHAASCDIVSRSLSLTSPCSQTQNDLFVLICRWTPFNQSYGWLRDSWANIFERENVGLFSIMPEFLKYQLVS